MTQEAAWSSGGRGGTFAVLEDLEIAAAALGAAAADLDDAARTLGVAAHLCEWRPERAGLAVQATACAAAAAVAAEDLRALAAAVTDSVAAYLEAELDARAAASRASLSLPAMLRDGAADWAGGVAWTHRWGAALAMAASPVVGAVRAFTSLDPVGAVAPAGPPPTTSALTRDSASVLLGATGDAYPDLARALACAVAAAEALEPRHRSIAVDPREPPRFEPPASVEAVVRRLGWLESRGDGTVAIETIVDGGGGTRHLVYVPGTQDWGVVDANPADLQANLASVVGDGSDAARTVVEAMVAHGIGPDEPVLLAGHSQGGMVATIVAGALAGRYRITHVVTAGSPTGRLTLPTAVEALHLENTRDLVPGLDGAPNPDRPHRVTVSHDRRRASRPHYAGAAPPAPASPSAPASPPDGSRTVAEAHGIGGYGATASLVDRGLSPSTQSWLDGARPYLEGTRTSLTAYRPVAG